MSTTLASPPSATSSSTSFPLTTSKAPSRPKPVNVFSNDGSFLERFQRGRQEEEDRRKVEEALTNRKKQFSDRFKNRGKRPPPPDSSSAVTRIDRDSNPTKKPKLDNVSQNSEHKDEVRDRTGRILKDTDTGVRPLVK